MAKAKQSRDEILAGLLRKFPSASNRALGERLHSEHQIIFPTINSARCAVRWARGVRGPRSRTTGKRLHVDLPPLPESLAGEWKPFELNSPRVLVLSDIHIPFQDNRALEAALAYGDDYNPSAVFINGDLFDFYQISRFDKCPTIASVSSELLAGGQFFDHLRKRYPRAKLYFKLGNHDERWGSYIFKAAPLLADVPGILDHWHKPAGIERNQVTVIGDQRPVMLGKLMVLHGHEKGKGISNPVNQARGAFLRLLTSCLEGHGHRQSEHEERTADDRLIVCRSTACLCGLWPDYAKCNKWGHGFATVNVAKDGEYEVQLKRIRHGKIY